MALPFSGTRALTLTTTDGCANSYLSARNTQSDNPAPLQSVAAADRPIIPASLSDRLTPEQQQANRHAFANFLRNPDLHQIRGPLAGWVQDDADNPPTPAFCLIGAYDVWIAGGYFLNPTPDDDALPDIFVAPYEYPLTDPVFILGMARSDARLPRMGQWIEENDYGTTTFAEFADRLDALPLPG